MCLICMKCGKCPGIIRNEDAAGMSGRQLYCLKCGEPITDEKTCPSCGAPALVPPGTAA